MKCSKCDNKKLDTLSTCQSCYDKFCEEMNDALTKFESNGGEFHEL